MQPDRDIDIRVAQEIFGHEVIEKNNVLHERTDLGESPLKFYSRNMDAAWLVASKMRVSLIPVENNNWFAFVDPLDGWSSPEAFSEFLKKGNFTLSGAAVQASASEAICEAALVANQKRRNQMAATEPAKASSPILDESMDPDSTVIH